MSKRFEQALAAHLQAKTKPTASERRLMRILELPADNRRRQRVLGHVEATATAELRNGGTVGAIDWSSIDWEKLLASIMKLIEMILKLFA